MFTFARLFKMPNLLMSDNENMDFTHLYSFIGLCSTLTPDI